MDAISGIVSFLAGVMKVVNAIMQYLHDRQLINEGHIEQMNTQYQAGMTVIANARKVRQDITVDDADDSLLVDPKDRPTKQ